MERPYYQMKLVDEKLSWSATDLSNFSACAHKTLLDREVAHGRLTRPHHTHPAKKLLEERGIEHEARYRAVLESRYQQPVHRVSGGIPKTAIEWEAATGRTFAAMQAGHQVIYQAPLALGDWRGIADFLVRVDHSGDVPPSALGGYHYEVVDTKLSQEARASAILQLCVYSEIVGRLQGRSPERLHVASPSGATSQGEAPTPVEHTFRTSQFMAYFRQIRERFAQFVQDHPLDETYPEPVEHCDVCPWWSRCEKRRRDDDHLSLVAGMGRGHRKQLLASGIETLEALGKAALPLDNRPKKLPVDILERLHHQARLQLQARSSSPTYELLPVEPERGLCRLPEPSAGDVYFDIEADRYAIDGTLHYLLGWCIIDERSKPHYTRFWAHDREAEYANFLQFVDFIVQRRAHYPDMHVYHFAPFEKVALGEMMGRYAAREEAIDAFFRNGVFVDLMPVVKQGLRAGVESYSIKELEQFYGYTRLTDLREASQSRRIYELNRVMGKADNLLASLPTIEGYNREDCESTFFLHRWLERERDGLVQTGADVPRLVIEQKEGSEDITDWVRRVQDVRARLLAGVPKALSQQTPQQRARQLMADVVDWHRRESNPAWWDYFRLGTLTPEELTEESGPLGNLGPLEKGDPIGKSSLYHSRFPSQDYSIKPGDQVICPVIEKSVGKVHAIDRAQGVVTFKRQKPYDFQPIGLATKPIAAKAQQQALMEIAERLAFEWDPNRADDFFGDTDTHFAAAQALLMRKAPQLTQGADLQLPVESATDAMRRVAPHLSGTVLAVQGPPGAGKTYSGSRLILELARAEKTVGITATSHKVIENLLSGIHHAAAEAGVKLRSLQKPKSGGKPLDLPGNKLGKNADAIVAALQEGEADVIAGTAWLFSDVKMRAALNVLVVDEAGQFSLANALAVSTTADSLVLLGDPQQLPQPSKGSHPEGAGVSALEHLVQGDREEPRETIERGKGLFMERTWRLPPAVAEFTSEFFYNSKLKAHPHCERQALAGGGSSYQGAGLHFHPVSHDGNVNHSPEEAAAICNIVDNLLRVPPTWTSRAGESRQIGESDILVVAPYNSQVQELLETLDAHGYADVAVGTVDKFQGQEAPIVIYSMATSNPEDAPRGFDFLFSLNRLNVATSRSQAVVIIVGSPRLLEANCRTPKQMRLVNGFCGAVETARHKD